VVVQNRNLTNAKTLKQHVESILCVASLAEEAAAGAVRVVLSHSQQLKSKLCSACQAELSKSVVALVKGQAQEGLCGFSWFVRRKRWEGQGSTAAARSVLHWFCTGFVGNGGSISSSPWAPGSKQQGVHSGLWHFRHVAAHKPSHTKQFILCLRLISTPPQTQVFLQ